MSNVFKDNAVALGLGITGLFAYIHGNVSDAETRSKEKDPIVCQAKEAPSKAEAVIGVMLATAGVIVADNKKKSRKRAKAQPNFG